MAESGNKKISGSGSQSRNGNKATTGTGSRSTTQKRSRTATAAGGSSAGKSGAAGAKSKSASSSKHQVTRTVMKSSSDRQMTSVRPARSGRVSAGDEAAENRRYTKARSSSYETERENEPVNKTMVDEIVVIISLVVALLMVLSLFDVVGIVGKGINCVTFGLFGKLAYALPFLLVIFTLFFAINDGLFVSKLRIICSVVLFINLSALIHMIGYGINKEINIWSYFPNSAIDYAEADATGAGLLGGFIVKPLNILLDKVGTMIVIIAVILAMLVVITGKAFILYYSKKLSSSAKQKYEEYRISRKEQRLYDRYENDGYEEDDAEEYPASGRTHGAYEENGRRMGSYVVSSGKNKKGNRDKVNAYQNAGEASAANTDKRYEEEDAFPAYAEDINEENESAFDGSDSNFNLESEPADNDFTVKGSFADEELDRKFAGKTEKADQFERRENGKHGLTQTIMLSDEVYHAPEKVVSLRAGSNAESFNSPEDGEYEFSAKDFEEAEADNTRSAENEGITHTRTWQNASDGENEGSTGSRKNSDTDKPAEGHNEDVTGDDVRNMTSWDHIGNADGNMSSADHTGGDVRNMTSWDHIGNNDGNMSSAAHIGDAAENGAASDYNAEVLENSASPDYRNVGYGESQPESDRNDYSSANTYSNQEQGNLNEKSRHYSVTQRKPAQEEPVRDTSGSVRFTDMDAEPEKTLEKIIPEYVFPPVDFLKKGKGGNEKTLAANRELEETKVMLKKTFESFGVGVTVTDASVGPTVTRYEILPDQGVKVKTITALSDDIALALAATEIRFEAPIPGKAAVGIEVPNKESSPVFFGDLIDSEEFRKAKSKLTIAIGKDIGGKLILSDIAGMPHALIAGSTGSGKSVCINALIMSILYKAKPSEVKMIMVDPKRVELVGYNGIPHLLVPVVTDVKKATGALNWAIAEMDNRYQLFADAMVNNLASYNEQLQKEYEAEGNTGDCPKKLPQIVIIIDELNDLMMTGNAKEVEGAICRLTQLARACGIHVILATQRPSVNVITGTIKANIPTRMAFAVSSLVDSRTIIDQAGADKLIGKGDMLFYPQGYPKPVRLQGAFVSDSEVKNVVDFIKENSRKVEYSEVVKKHLDNVEEAKGGNQSAAADNGAPERNDDRDELFEQAGMAIIDKEKASIGMLQRLYRIGFNRSARIMDQLCEAGVVGPEEGTKPRKILMTKQQFEEYLDGAYSEEQ